MSVFYPINDTTTGVEVAVSELISGIEYDSQGKIFRLRFTDRAVESAKFDDGNLRIGIQLQTRLPQNMPLVALNVAGSKYLNPNEMSMPQTLSGFVSHSYFGADGEKTFTISMPVNLNTGTPDTVIFHIYVERDIGFGYWSTPQLAHGMCSISVS